METFIPQRFGKFFLINFLGKGGMANVFLATDVEKFDSMDPYKSFVALKQLFPKYSAQPGFVKCLVDEAKLTSILKHPNVVEVYDLGNVATDFYLTMSWVNGRSLHHLLQAVRDRNKVISKSFLFYIFQKVAHGLNYAHELKDSANRPLNLVHCDISPQNILIGYEGEVKLSDFGIATAEKSQEKASSEALLGKLPYMAPEQITLKGFDRRVDIYSFGVLMYEGLTGRKPLDAMSIQDLQNKIIKEIPSYTSKVFISHPRVKNFIEACLSKDPNNRPSSISEFFQLDDEIDDADQIKISKLMKLLFQEELKKEKTNIQLAIPIMSAMRLQEDQLDVGSDEYSGSQEKSSSRRTEVMPYNASSEMTKVTPAPGTYEPTKVAFDDDEKESVGKIQIQKREVVRIIKKKPVEEEWGDSDPTQRKLSRDMLEETIKAEQNDMSLDDVFGEDTMLGAAPSSEKTIVDFDETKWSKHLLTPTEKRIEVTDRHAPNKDKKIKEPDSSKDQNNQFEAQYPSTGEFKGFQKIEQEEIQFPEEETREAKIQLKVVRKPLSEVKVNIAPKTNPIEKQNEENFFQEISSTAENQHREQMNASLLKSVTRTDDSFIFKIKKRTLLAAVLVIALIVVATSKIKNRSPFLQTPTATSKTIRTIDFYISVQDLENMQEKTSVALWMDPAFQKTFIGPIESFFTREYQSYTNDQQTPYRFVFSGLERATPKIPWQGGLFNALLPFDKFSKIFQIDSKTESGDHGRIFIHLYAKQVNTPSDYPIDYQGSRPAHEGVLYYPLFSETDTEFQLRLAHEILHMLGAKDLYNDKGLPKYPEGYVDPFKEPLHPQKFGEIMSRSIAENPSEYIPLSSLDDAKIGAYTAYEIGWITEKQKNDFYKR